MTDQTPKGLICPNSYCKHLIQFSYSDLLKALQIECPKCKLKLELKTLDDIKGHLANITVAEVNVAKTRNREK